MHSKICLILPLSEFRWRPSCFLSRLWENRPRIWNQHEKLTYMSTPQTTPDIEHTLMMIYHILTLHECHNHDHIHIYGHLHPWSDSYTQFALSIECFLNVNIHNNSSIGVIEGIVLLLGILLYSSRYTCQKVTVMSHIYTRVTGSQVIMICEEEKLELWLLVI